MGKVRLQFVGMLLFAGFQFMVQANNSAHKGNEKVNYDLKMYPKNRQFIKYSVSKNAQGDFVFEWNDTLCLNENFDKATRPVELYCCLRTPSGDVFSYSGNNTENAKITFSTSDSFALALFYIGPNRVSHEHVLQDIKKYEEYHVGSEYYKVRISLKDNYTDSAVVLTNPEVVYCTAIPQKDDHFKPHQGVSYNSFPFALNRFYLHPKSGRIERGEYWLFELKVKGLFNTPLHLIDPAIGYPHKTKGSVRGITLIQQKKIDMSQFPQWNDYLSEHWNALPY